jgi:Tol biopolymer transport system component
MKSLIPNIYEFDTFRLDTKNACLLREEEMVRLTPKVFDLLVILVENQGRMLERDALLNAIWADAAVEEANLTQSISILRRSLGCGQNGQRYIETIPKRGYRFVAEVRIVEEEDELVIHKHTRAELVIEEENINDEVIVPAATVANQTILTPTTEIVKTRSRLLSRKILLAVSIILVLIVAGISWKLISKRLRQTAVGVPASLKMNTLYSWKTEPGEAATGAVFAPSGKLIAFSASKDGHNDIWIKQIVGGEPIQILNDQWSDYSPIWSPDEQFIAFLSDRGNSLGIWTIPTFGGTPKLLTPLETTPRGLVCWSKTSDKIYYEMRGNLYSCDVASGEIAQITHFDPAQATVSSACISPDEKEIVYTDIVDKKSHIFVMPLSGGTPKQISSDDYNDKDPKWFADGERIIYSSNRAGIYQLCVAYKDGQEPEQITFGNIDARAPSASPDGRSLLFISTNEEGNIYYCDAQSGNEYEFTSTHGLQLWPDFSPNGEVIAYQATTEKIKITEGSVLAKQISSQSPVLELANPGFDVQWSPNGNRLAFLRGSFDQPFFLWSVNSIGTGEKQLTSNPLHLDGFTGIPYNRFQTKNYSWSPDSSKIAYCSLVSGVSNIWTVSSDGSTDTNLSNNQDASILLGCPLWSPDGDQLAYTALQLSPSVKKFRSIWIQGDGQPELIFQAESNLRLLNWSKFGNEIYLALIKNWLKGSQTQTVEIVKVSIKSKATEIIGTLEQTYFYNIRLSTDGKNFAFASRMDGKDNVWLLSATGGIPVQVTKNSDPRVYLSSLTWSPDVKTIFYSKQKSWSLVTLIENFR